LFFNCRFLGTEPILTERESGQRRQVAFYPGVISMPNAASSLFDDPRDVLRNSSPDRPVDMLRRVTLAFVDDADRSSDKQARRFDEMPERLIDRIEARAPAGIGARPRHRK
jgi:hypothetical protein